MSLPLKDVRFTTRRSRGDPDAAPALYPRLLRDRSVVPKVAITIEYFESMLGKERRELDPEVLVQFFGDHKLARCMVAALAHSYRYRNPALEEVVSRGAWRRLQRKGLTSPKALRLRLFDRLNEANDGFLRGADRAETLGQIEAELGLRTGELERLLYLDAAEHAVLVRTGARPRPEDAIAQYNFAVLSTLLRHAEHVDLLLAATEGAPAHRAAAIEQLCAANDVGVRLKATGRSLALRLVGRQDALGLWSRHGRRLARTVAQLVERGGREVIDGAATVAIRGRRALLRLTDEALGLLGGGDRPGAGWETADGWDETSVAAAVRAPRRPGPPGPGGPGTPRASARASSAAGRPAGAAARASARATGRAVEQVVAWGVRRLPDGRAWAGGVAVPDVLLRLGDRSVLVCAARSPAHGARLAALAPAAAGGEPIVYAGAAASLEPLAAGGATTVPLPRFDVAAVAQALWQSAEPAGWPQLVA